MCFHCPCRKGKMISGWNLFICGSVQFLWQSKLSDMYKIYHVTIISGFNWTLLVAVIFLLTFATPTINLLPEQHKSVTILPNTSTLRPVPSQLSVSSHTVIASNLCKAGRHTVSAFQFLIIWPHIGSFNTSVSTGIRRKKNAITLFLTTLIPSVVYANHIVSLLAFLFACVEPGTTMSAYNLWSN